MYQFNHFESMQVCVQTNFVIGIDGQTINLFYSLSLCHCGGQNLSTESVAIVYLTQLISRIKANSFYSKIIVHKQIRNKGHSQHTEDVLSILSISIIVSTGRLRRTSSILKIPLDFCTHWDDKLNPCEAQHYDYILQIKTCDKINEGLLNHYVTFSMQLVRSPPYSCVLLLDPRLIYN